MRVIEANNNREIRKLMQGIRVDPYGIDIMAPKANVFLIRLDSVSNICANILKQEMLSLGADAAVARGALTGKVKKTDCLLMGNLSQFNRLNLKLRKQPFGLDDVARQLNSALKNYQRDDFLLKVGSHKLDLARRTRIMGILNITPDSFSGDGLLACGNQDVIPIAEKMVCDGADIIDIGGESTRPGSRPISVREELQRVIPAVKAISKKIRVPVSIDTYKPEVAKQALDNGAVIVNDITGLRDGKIARLVARYGAGIIIMHMQGNPRTMQKNPQYKNLIEEISGFLRDGISRAIDLGVSEEKIIIDPGIGFGKSLEHNLEILKRLKEFRSLGRPVMVGVSRKAFIGKILNVPCGERLSGTLSACVLAARNGAKIVRVHDVKKVKDALEVADRINNI